jgi:hypothetical protein
VRGALAVAIRPVDDAPTAQPPALNTNEDTPAGGTLAMSDVDGDALAIVIVAQPSSGRVTIDDAAKGAFTFAPAQDFHGDVTFRVAATETASGKLTSAPVEVAVKVAPVNDPPATRDVTAKTAEDTATTVTVAAEWCGPSLPRERLTACCCGESASFSTRPAPMVRICTCGPTSGRGACRCKMRSWDISGPGSPRGLAVVVRPSVRYACSRRRHCCHRSEGQASRATQLGPALSLEWNETGAYRPIVRSRDLRFRSSRTF